MTTIAMTAMMMVVMMIVGDYMDYIHGQAMYGNYLDNLMCVLGEYV